MPRGNPLLLQSRVCKRAEKLYFHDRRDRRSFERDSVSVPSDPRKCLRK